jgi:hypothetical protein
MRNMTVCVTACLTVLAGLAATLSPLRVNAQDASPSTKFGDILFGVNRPQLNAYVRQQQAQNAWIQAETAAAEADIALTRQQNHLRALVEARRKWLAQTWVDLGCSPADAVDRAYAWSPSLSDQAVVRQLQREGSKSAIPAINDATMSFNYALADQLMLAFVLVHADEQRTAELPTTTVDHAGSVAPDSMIGGASHLIVEVPITFHVPPPSIASSPSVDSRNSTGTHGQPSCAAAHRCSTTSSNSESPHH